MKQKYSCFLYIVCMIDICSGTHWGGRGLKGQNPLILQKKNRRALLDR